MVRRIAGLSRAPRSATKLAEFDTLRKPLGRYARYTGFRDRVMSPFGRHITTATMIKP